MRRGAALVAAAVLLTACGGLPTSGGAQAPGELGAREQRTDPGISALVSGPRQGDSPEQVVRGFLQAQVSAEDDHAVARSWFAPGADAAWDPGVGVVLYDGGLSLQVTETAPGSWTTTVSVLARLDAVGAATTLERPDAVALDFTVGQLPDGQWRLLTAPPGLALTPEDRDLAFRPYDVFHLAPDAPARQGTRHLVADRVFVSVDDEPAQALVDRVLAGPSVSLAEAATSAAPPGLTAVVTDEEVPGQLAVDLDPAAQDLPPLAREQLSAQLVWTLRQVEPFSGMRLLAGGEPLAVGRISAGPQPRAAWGSYDPDAGTGRAPALVVTGGQLRPLPPQPGEPQEGGRLTSALGVVDAAVSPRGARVAVLTDAGGGLLSLGISSAGGPLETHPETQAVEGLSSPTWGSGERGLFLLRRLGDARQVVMVPPGQAPVVVPVALPTDLRDGLVDPTVLRVSRDGVRVALVDAGVLLVGRIVAGPDQQPVRITGLSVLARDVVDVAWLDGTSVVALVGAGPRLPQQLSVDGTAQESLSRLGLQGDPVRLAAAQDRPLLVETVVDGLSATYRDDGTDFARVPGPGGRPLYPG